MLAVVVDELQGDPKDLAQRAVEVLGGTAYDVRASLTVPGGGPAVLAVVAESDRAEALRAGLEARGMRTTVVSVRADRPMLDVRRFSLEPRSLEVEDRDGRRCSVPFSSVGVLVRASAVETKVSTKTIRERKFNPMRSVLSGGLVNTSVKVTKKRQRETDSDELLFLFSRGSPPLRLSERNLQYQGLGDALQPSRMANFLFTANAIVQGCPRARLDERLRRRSFQSQLLGRTLSPDEHIDFAVHLVAQSLQRPLPSQPRL
ncbi:MAG: hypothetical protein ACRBN8_12945 [Nannocystales bacterium]